MPSPDQSRPPAAVKARIEELRAAEYWFSHRPEWYWRFHGALARKWRRFIYGDL